MKKSAGFVFATALMLAAGWALTARSGEATKEVILPAGSLQWEDGPEGTKFATLWGDMNAGPFGVLVKFKAGTVHPLHKHTHDLKLVVISGTFWHTPEGGAETRLGPGSYMLVPGGQNHSSGCTAEGECEFFMTSEQKFDLIPAGEK